MGLSDMLEMCQKCGAHNWINYGEGYIECASCGCTIKDFVSEWILMEDEINEEDDGGI
jgi:transcription initiation factor TFIIIB Brf1 subunit/transcription initiation factor TFIIB